MYVHMFIEVVTQGNCWKLKQIIVKIIFFKAVILGSPSSVKTESWLVLVSKHLWLWLIVDFNILLQIQQFSISASVVLSAVAASTLELKAFLHLTENV